MTFSKAIRHFAVKSTSCAAATENEDTLFLIHILTRHGDRTAKSTFPTDQHKSETFYPVGKGRLTNEGKKNIYENGLYLKTRYQKFLGDVYNPYEVEVIATEYERTKMTAQVAMAAMYPPKSPQIWHPTLHWQPIPIKYAHREHDLLFLGEHSCKKFVELQKKNTEEQQQRGNFKQFEPLFKCLSQYTGLNVTVPFQVTRIHDTLKCQKEWGLKLPQWAIDLYPDMEAVVEFYWIAYAPTDELKRLGAGFMIKKIVNDTMNKIKGIEPNKHMKLHFYSGHDSSIVALLQLLGAYDGHIVNYGGYVLIEIHKKWGKYLVKVFYHNDKQLEPRPLKLRNCSHFLELDTFVDNYKKYFGEPSMCKP